MTPISWGTFVRDLSVYSQLKSCEYHQKALHNGLNASGKASALAAFFLPEAFTMVVKVCREHALPLEVEARRLGGLGGQTPSRA